MLNNDNLEQNLVCLKDGVPKTTSLNIAEYFGKNHYHLLRDIEQLACTKEFSLSNFGLSSYINSQNKKQPMYEITKEGFMLLVLGFTGQKNVLLKEKFVNLFSKMENRLKEITGEYYDLIPKTYIEALKKYTNELEKNNELEAKIKRDEFKVQYAETVQKSSDTMEIGKFAKLLATKYKTGRNRIFEWLRDNKYLMNDKNHWNEPYQNYITLEYFEVIETPYERNSGNTYTPLKTLITGKGRVYITNMWLKSNRALITNK